MTERDTPTPPNEPMWQCRRCDTEYEGDTPDHDEQRLCRPDTPHDWQRMEPPETPCGAPVRLVEYGTCANPKPCPMHDQNVTPTITVTYNEGHEGGR